MASALTVLLLGCWLAGWSGVWGEPSYPKLTIKLRPSGGVSLGGPMSIRCEGQRWGVQIVLYKDGRHFQTIDSTGPGAAFPIRNVSREQGGIYNCSYHHGSEPVATSSPSDPLEVVVRDPSFPRPSISLSFGGRSVTTRCEGPRRDVRFFLHKAGDLNPPRPMDPAGAGAEFHIPTVDQQYGGNYSCSYRPRSEPFVSSQPSHPVQLVVADYTRGNILRLFLSAGVLLALALILAEFAHGWRTGGREVEGRLWASPDLTTQTATLPNVPDSESTYSPTGHEPPTEQDVPDDASQGNFVPNPSELDPSGEHGGSRDLL